MVIFEMVRLCNYYLCYYIFNVDDKWLYINKINVIKLIMVNDKLIKIL